MAFKDIRKSANELYCDLIDHGGRAEELEGVEELSHRFLGQKTPSLVRLYRTAKKKMYIRMNFHLAKLGEFLRSNGVFAKVK